MIIFSLKCSKGFVSHLVLLVFLLISIPLGLYLVYHPQILFPKAYNTPPNKLESFTNIEDALNAYNNSDLGKQQADLKAQIDQIAHEQEIIDVEEDQAYKNVYGQDKNTLLKQVFDLPEVTPDNEIDPAIKRALKDTGISLEGDITGDYEVKLPPGCFAIYVDGGGAVPPICSLNVDPLINLGYSALEFLLGDFIHLYKLQQETAELNQQVLDLFSQSGINDRSNPSEFDFDRDDDLTIRSKFLKSDLNNYPDDTLTQDQKEARDELREVFIEYTNAYYLPQNHLRYMALLGTVFGKVSQGGAYLISKLPSTPLVLRLGDRIRGIFKYRLSDEGDNIASSIWQRLSGKIRISFDASHLGPMVINRNLRPIVGQDMMSSSSFSLIEESFKHGQAYVLDPRYSNFYLKNMLAFIDQLKEGYFKNLMKPYRAKVLATANDNWTVVVTNEAMVQISGSASMGNQSGKLTLLNELIPKERVSLMAIHEYIHLITSHIRRGGLSVKDSFFRNGQPEFETYGRVMSQLYELSTDLLADEMIYDATGGYKVKHPKLYLSIKNLINLINLKTGNNLAKYDLYEFALTGRDDVLMEKISRHMSPQELIDLIDENIDLDALKLRMDLSRERSASLVIGNAMFFGVIMSKGSAVPLDTPIIYETPDYDEDIDIWKGPPIEDTFNIDQ